LRVAYRADRDDDDLLLHEPVDRQLRMTFERVVLDLAVEGVLAADIEVARHLPADVVREQVQDRLVVARPESVEVGAHRLLLA
jgi:hypothetical protein